MGSAGTFDLCHNIPRWSRRPGAAERLTSGDMRPGTEDRSLGVGILTLSPDSPA